MDIKIEVLWCHYKVVKISDKGIATASIPSHDDNQVETIS
jgi:hypothetical protein